MGFLEKILGRYVGGHHSGTGKHGSGRGHHGRRDDEYNRGYDRPVAATGGPLGNDCSNCGTTSAQGARFCQQCGSALTSPPCKCGSALPSGAMFCLNCGKPAK